MLDPEELQESESWIPEKIPADKPSAARIYDHLLGGYHNFACDRAVVEQLLVQYPDMKETAQINRAFLRRAVNYLLEQGIEQFLDLGSGIPTVGNVHQLAQAAIPTARVVYVDIDPIAVAHSKAILADNPYAAAIRADVRDTEKILTHPDLNQLLDFTKPIGLMLVALLHYVIDDAEALSTVNTLKDAISLGSFLTICHPAHEATPENIDDLHETFKSAQDFNVRSRVQIEKYFTGFEPIPPGLVLAPLWRPESPQDVGMDNPEKSFTLAGIGKKI